MTCHLPPVSVVVPTYNRREMLMRALHSVFHQSVACREILVVDDASTDGSREYVESNIDREWRGNLRWLDMPSNRGPAAARNLGIAHARGELIAFLDSDDHWHPRKIERQAELMADNPRYHISHTRETWLRRGQHLNQKKKHLPRHGDIFSHCLELCAVGMSTVMAYRKLFDTVGYFDEDMRCCEDYAFWLKVSCRFPFLLVDEQLTVKEGGRPDQISTRYRQGMDRLRVEALERLVRSGVLTAGQRREAIQELRRKCAIYGQGCLKHGRTEEGMHFLALAETMMGQLENDSAKREKILA